MTRQRAYTALAAAALAAALSAPAAAADFERIAPTETALDVVDGLVTARLSPDGCASGFEAACTATRQRAEFQAATPHVHGDRVSYRWEIMVPAGFTMNAVDKHLYATRFLTGEDSSVLQFYLGTDYGYEVNRKTCIAPEALGEWHQIEVRVVWDSTKKKGLKDKTPGEIRVLCDGTEVFAAAGRPNIKEGQDVRLALGLEGAIALAEGDDVAVSFRNIEIGAWE
jgi:hypothetical protein